MVAISASVGLGAVNRRPDVIAVQSLLDRAEMAPGPIDGRCGRRTIGVIERFQQGVLRRPDGRVDVNGPTLRHLTGHQRSITLPAGRAPPGRVPSGQTISSQIPSGSAASGQTPRRAAPPVARPAERQPAAFWAGHTALPALTSIAA